MAQVLVIEVLDPNTLLVFNDLSELTETEANLLYLRLDGGNVPTATLDLHSIRPETTGTYDSGEEANQWRQGWFEQLRVFEGSGTLNASAPADADKSAVIGYAQADGTGAATITAVASDTIDGLATVIGSALVEAGSSGNASLLATGVGSLVIGSANVLTTGSGDATISAGSRGAVAIGNVNNIISSGSGLISATAPGGLATGYIQLVFSSYDHEITAATGAFAGGSIITNAGSTQASRIAAAGGALAHANVANNAVVNASVSGSTAIGNASGYDILAAGLGSLAIGSATAANIEATATNSFQFAPGVNPQAISLQVGVAGTGIALKGSSGAFSAQNDGQIWNTSGDVFIRSNSHDVAVDVNQTYTVTGGYTPDRAFDPTSTTLTEVAHILATFIDDHIAVGQVQ